MNNLAYMLKDGGRVLVVIWLEILAEKIEFFLRHAAITSGASHSNYKVCTRGADLSVDPAPVFHYFESQNPQITVIDPFAVGEPPTAGSEYKVGANLVGRIDQAEECQQIVWTSLPKDTLPIRQSLFIPQAMTLGEVTEAMENSAREVNMRKLNILQ